MVTISKTVEHLVLRQPFLEEALKRGIVNYAALAEQMQSAVETTMGAKVKTSAIMMALRRMDTQSKIPSGHTIVFSNECDIGVKSDLFECTIRRDAAALNAIELLYSQMKQEDFLAITQGLTQITIIANRRHMSRVKIATHKCQIIKTIDHLACLSTTLPAHSTQQPGYFYELTKAFAWQGINLIEIVSTLTELNFIMREKDIPRSFETIKELFADHQKASKDEV